MPCYHRASSLQITSNGSGQVDYLSWSRGVNLEDIPFVVQHCRTVGPLTLSALNKHELQLLHNMLGRLFKVAEAAAEVCGHGRPESIQLLPRFRYREAHHRKHPPEAESYHQGSPQDPRMRCKIRLRSMYLSWQLNCTRCSALCSSSDGFTTAQSGVRMMIDAEHSYFQPAIDHAAMEVQRRFNQRVPTVYNTYQCYLKDSQPRCRPVP